MNVPLLKNGKNLTGSQILAMNKIYRSFLFPFFMVIKPIPGIYKCFNPW